MKKCLLVAVLFVFVLHLNANEHLEQEEKGIVKGIIYSVVFPGAGLFYTNNHQLNTNGLSYMAVEVGLLGWFINDIGKSEGNNAIIPATMLIIVKACECFDIFNKVKDHNKTFREDFSLIPEVDFNNDKISLGLAYRF